MFALYSLSLFSLFLHPCIVPPVYMTASKKNMSRKAEENHKQSTVDVTGKKERNKTVFSSSERTSKDIFISEMDAV